MVCCHLVVLGGYLTKFPNNTQGEALIHICPLADTLVLLTTVPLAIGLAPQRRTTATPDKR